MFKKKHSVNPQNVDTLIGVNTVLEGNIESQGTVRVDGKVKGDIRINGDLFIGDKATIIGRVFASSVDLAGTVEGDIHSTGILRIQSTAKIFGDIQVQSFIADEGGIFQGKCSMLDDAGPEKVTEKTSSKKHHPAKDFKKSSVLDQLYDDKEKNDIKED